MVMMIVCQFALVFDYVVTGENLDMACINFLFFYNFSILNAFFASLLANVM